MKTGKITHAVFVPYAAVAVFHLHTKRAHKHGSQTCHIGSEGDWDY
jgi:hypothetical protein